MTKAQKELLEKQKQKILKSLQKQLDEHKNKLKAYKKNPDAFDNKGFLKQAGDNKARREKIINGRVKHLETEIQTFKNNMDKIE